ncbi:MAG: MFS transporter [Pseudonocardiales bacterium]|nr:MAG: MFS transporter [Pseudonocardiales bacterium]
MYASSATSNLADGIGRTALPLLAATYTRSPLLISGLVTFAFLPWLLFALPSGALVDRVDRRHAMSGANVVRAVSTATLAVLVLTDLANISVLYVVAFALGLAETVYDSASRAILPQVVPAERLDSANSALTVEEMLGQTFLGAPVGSVLFTLAATTPFLINAGGFALAAVLMLTLRGNYRPVRSDPKTSLRVDIAEGVSWLRAHRLLRGLTLVSAGAAGLSSMTSGVLVLYVLEELRLPSGDFGLVLITAGLGGLLGGLATPPLARRLGRTVVLTGGSVLSAVTLGLMGLTRNGYLAAMLFGICGAGVMTWNVLTMSLRQALIPHELFGRVQGAYRTLVWGAIAAGSVSGGAVASVIGLRPVFLLAGLGCLVTAVLLGLLLRANAGDLADLPSSEAVISDQFGDRDGSLPPEQMPEAVQKL